MTVQAKRTSYKPLPGHILPKIFPGSKQKGRFLAEESNQHSFRVLVNNTICNHNNEKNSMCSA